MAEDLQLKMYISARTEQLELALQKAEQKTQQTMRKIDGLQAAPGGGIGGGLSFRGGELLGGLAKGVVTVAALQGGVQLVHAAVSAMRGEWEGVEEVVRRLPGGVGALVGSVIDLTRELSGSADEAARIKKEADAIKTAFAASTAFTSGINPTAVANERERLAWMAGGGAEGQLAAAAFDRDQRIRDRQLAAAKAQREIAPMRKSDLVAWSQESGKIDERLQQDILEEQAAFERKRFEIMANETQRKWALQTEEINKEQQFQDRMADLRGKLVESELEAAGETLDAKLEAIENSYNAQIAKATAGEKELLEKIKEAEKSNAVRLDEERQREAIMAERGREYDMMTRARDQAEGRVRSRIAAIQGQSLSAQDAGFLTRGTGTDRSTEIADEQLKVQRETQRILADMRQEQRRKKEFVEVGFP